MTDHIRFRRAYDDHPRYKFQTVGVSLTHQAMSEECDINRIMAKYQKTGVLTHVNTFQGQYGDYTETPSNYQDSLNAVIQAEEMFSSLPSSVRKRFQNDPGAFIDFVADPDNKDELIRLGLATPSNEGGGSPKPSDGSTPPKDVKAAPAAPKEPPAKED